MSDIRTARRRHAVEMQYMAQRPFATQNIVLEPNNILAVRNWSDKAALLELSKINVFLVCLTKLE